MLGGIIDDELNEKKVERTLANILPKIFRRPLAPLELERYYNLFRKTKATKTSSFFALRVVLKAALVSPHFLFREEYQVPENDYQLILIEKNTTHFLIVRQKNF